MVQEDRRTFHRRKSVPLRPPFAEQQDDKTKPNIAQEHLSHCRKSFSSFRFSTVAGTILKLDEERRAVELFPFVR